ncbi:hypothetical protein N9219_00985 [bacterium]|nr:hypothetical protein [bacterium]
MNIRQYRALLENFSPKTDFLLSKKENLAYSLRQELTAWDGLEKPSLMQLLKRALASVKKHMKEEDGNLKTILET